MEDEDFVVIDNQGVECGVEESDPKGDLLRLLKGEGFEEEVIETFKAKEIDYYEFLEMTEERISELGLDNQKQKLLNLIARLRNHKSSCCVLL